MQIAIDPTTTLPTTTYHMSATARNRARGAGGDPGDVRICDQAGLDERRVRRGLASACNGMKWLRHT